MKALFLAGLAILVAKPGGAQVPLTLDTSFRCTRFFSGELLDNLPLADGSVIATGYYAYLDNCCANPFRDWLRILSNGIIDESWASGLGRGLIYPFGSYYYVSGIPYRYFQYTGERDTSFPTVASYPDVLAGNMGNLAFLPDGGILHVGNMWLQEQWGINEPSPDYSLWRIDTSGALDSSYQWRKTDGIIWSIVPISQGRFLLSGVYNTYEGLPEGRIIRIWPDGSLDTTFHTDIIKGYAYNYIEQSNGRIIAGGDFVFSNEPDTMHLIRLMQDGPLDTTFNNHATYDRLPPTSFGALGFGVGDLQPLADGTMIVAGNFTHIDGQLRRGVALLDSTGHLLNTALNGEGALLTHDFNSTSMYSRVNSIRQAPDGSIFLSGVFHGFDDGMVSDTSITFIAKLHGLSTGIPEAVRPVSQVRVWPNPGMDVLHVEVNTMRRVDVRVLDAIGRVVLSATGPRGSLHLSSAGLSPGIYCVEVNSAEGRRTLKWIKR